MKLKDAKYFAPLVKAAADGKTIQYKSNLSGAAWVDLNGDCCFMEQYIEYGKGELRIKPESKLRPWTAEEGVGKTVRSKITGHFGIIVGWNSQANVFVVPGDLGALSFEWTPKYILENCVMMDGTPCGVEES